MKILRRLPALWPLLLLAAACAPDRSRHPLPGPGAAALAGILVQGMDRPPGPVSLAGHPELAPAVGEALRRRGWEIREEAPPLEVRCLPWKGELLVRLDSPWFVLSQAFAPGHGGVLRPATPRSFLLKPLDEESS